ncbi:hypothetical protein HME7025_01759 [Aquirufa nivalisilvae]|uniref:Uncharacterized protein n=1 Tax=Aquirufa nivalisilvae TaxID=2516557 RepID=A0A2S2DW34_9BACT|nr:hypothetical protein [Aquirufa nivalisilvae]AWL09611.1 hypothetical protein HME7025_01759 [Aquirufa nivalisilvae]
MAKKITKKEIEKNTLKTPKEEFFTGSLFHNQTEQKPEIPLKITNSEKVEIVEEISKSYNDETETKYTDDSIFSLTDNLYIEVHKSNLLQYFSAGCIFPSKYSSQKAFSDPQSINENGLLISNGFMSNDKDHILIQIDAFVIDKTLLSVNGSFGLYCNIIPVSRIIRLYVHDNETKRKTLDDSLIRDAGIIPDTLIEVGFPTNIAKVSFVEFNITTQNLESQIIKFDKILGLIAGARNFNLLTYNQTGKFKTISDHSLYAMQGIDETFGIEIVNSGHFSDYYKWLFTNSCPSDRPLLQWLFKRVYNYTNFTDSDTSEFESLCEITNSFLGEEKQVKDIFSALRKSLERKKAMNNIELLQSKNSLALYVFAYLRNFGTSQNPELPRVELVNSRINKFSEYAFATLNFFFGYKQLRNSEDRILISDDTIKKAIKIPNKPTIKFELSTEFDYRIIDSVFNLVFGIKITELVKHKNISVEQGNTSISIEGYDCYSTLIFGKLYHRILKSDIEDQLKKLPNEITIFSEFGLVCHRLGLKRYLIGLEELIGNPKAILRFVYYSKSDLIDAIRANKIDKDEIKYRIVLSQKHKEL